MSVVELRAEPPGMPAKWRSRTDDPIPAAQQPERSPGLAAHSPISSPLPVPEIDISAYSGNRLARTFAFRPALPISLHSHWT